MSGYSDAVQRNPSLAQVVTHPEDPDCPGHDINLILIAKSAELGYCLCIHPFMQVIDFHGMACDWCHQPVSENAMSPQMKDMRTQTVRAVLGDGRGLCRPGRQDRKGARDE